MHPHLGTTVGFEHGSALTGTFEVSLTRAVVPYTDEAQGSFPGGRLSDIGLGVVVDGSDPARADVLDLGSSEMKVVDLTGPLVVLGWLYPSGLRSLRRVVEGSDLQDLERTRAFTFGLGIKALQAAGFGPLTRPTVLRIGFRDLCHDLDLHEGTAVRMFLPQGGVVRFHMDYESVTLVARTGRSLPDSDLERALAQSFPQRELLRGTVRDPVGAQSYYLPLPIPRSLADTRDLLTGLRLGVLQLLARFEPDRCHSLREMTGTFGERDSLRSLRDRPDLPPLERVAVGRSGLPGEREVH